MGAALGGRWAEKQHPASILVITDIIRGVVQLCAAAVLMSGMAEPILAPIYFLFGFGIGASRPSAHIVLTNLIPPQALVSANSLLTFTDNLAAVLFPATLGVLIIIIDPSFGILIDGGTFIGAALLLSKLSNLRIDQQQETDNSSDYVSGISIIAHNRTLKNGIFATLIINVLCFPVFLVIAPYAISARVGDTVWGLCLAASGLGACVGTIVSTLTSAHVRILRLAFICGASLALAMTIMATAHNTLILIIGAIWFGIVEGAWLTSWTTAMQLAAPKKFLGRIVATETLLTSGAHPFIYLCSGFVGAAIGYPETLMVIGVISISSITLIILIDLVQARRNEHDQPY